MVRSGFLFISRSAYFGPQHLSSYRLEKAEKEEKEESSEAENQRRHLSLDQLEQVFR